MATYVRGSVGSSLGVNSRPNPLTCIRVWGTLESVCGKWRDADTSKKAGGNSELQNAVIT